MYSTNDAARAARALGVDFRRERFTVFDLTRGMNVEREHFDVTRDPAQIARIALAHLRERPDYYAKLAILEHSPLGQLTPTSARAIAQRFAPRSMHAFAHRRALGESPGGPEWERANLWKTGLVVGGLFVAIIAGAFLFLGAPKPYYSGRRSLVSTPPSARR